MGIGIAYVAATNAQIPVVLHDTNSRALEKGTNFLYELLNKNVSKQKLDASRAEEATKLVSTSTDFPESVSQADVVIEAIPEDPAIKAEIFYALGQLTMNKDTILASNTSSISLTKLAAAAKEAASRVIGLHFFNPVPVLKGAEVIRALQTSDAVHAEALQFIKRMGKVPSSSQDAPGFLGNRVLVPMINEAILLLESGTSSAEDIDNIMKFGCGLPMGPIALSDFIGNDTVLAIMDVLHKETGDSKYRASNMLRNYVTAGYLGKKSGRGFYKYK